MVDGDEGDVGAAGVFLLSREDVFRKYLHADFHRGAKDAIDAGFQDDPFADVDGKAEIHIVNRRGDAMAIGVTSGRERSGDIDQVHHAAAQHFAERVRVVGQHSLDDFGTRRAYRFSRQAGLRVDHFPISGALLRRVRQGEISFGRPFRGALDSPVNHFAPERVSTHVLPQAVTVAKLGGWKMNWLGSVLS
jgi:hypothetical protein